MDFFLKCNVKSEKCWTPWRPNFSFPVWQTVRRITNEILGVKGLKPVFRLISVDRKQTKNRLLFVSLYFFSKNEAHSTSK